MRIVGTRPEPTPARQVFGHRRLGYTDADIENGGSDRLMSDVVPHGPEASILRIAGHLDAGADHVVVQPLGDGGRFAPGDLKALSELTARLR